MDIQDQEELTGTGHKDHMGKEAIGIVMLEVRMIVSRATNSTMSTSICEKKTLKPFVS